MELGSRFASAMGLVGAIGLATVSRFVSAMGLVGAIGLATVSRFDSAMGLVGATGVATVSRFASAMGRAGLVFMLSLGTGVGSNGSKPASTSVTRTNTGSPDLVLITSPSPDFVTTAV